MKTGKLSTNSYFLGIAAALVAAALYSSSATAEQAHASAVIPSVAALQDHDALARFHENAANEMQGKAQEQKQLLEYYKAKSYLYGRQAQDLQARAHALARKYNKAAKTHAREAALHRERADKLAKDSFCAPPEKTELC